MRDHLPSDDESHRPNHPRRWVLRWVGSGGVIGLAGCGYTIDGEPPEPTPTATSTPTPTLGSTEKSTATPTDTPTQRETATTTAKPTYSYEAITGTWTGETNRRRHSFAEVEILESRATVGEELGIVKLFTEEGGRVVCQSSLFAHRSDPPTTFWGDVEGSAWPCDEHVRYRFHRESADLMRWFIRSEDGTYFEATSLNRESG